MSLTYSNILTVVAAVCLPVVGGRWIAPKLNDAERRCFFTLTLWGVPYVIGQCAQQDKWGSQWLQYHLLDLCFAPWATALAMCGLTLGAACFGKSLSSEATFLVSLRAVLVGGYITEVWDTAWAWQAEGSLRLAIDAEDYTTITLGGIAAIVIYEWVQQTALRRAVS